MIKRSIRKISPTLVILLLATCSIAYAQSSNNDITGLDTSLLAPVETSITSGITTVQVSSRYYGSQVPKIKDYMECNPDEEFPYRFYVTPEDNTIVAIAAQISDPRDAYQTAVQWIYVSEEKLNHAADKWLTPREFLANTPHYPSNPLKGNEVSDCEEQANTLVSLIRALGTRPEEIRVALGEVMFDDEATGHAWVELLTNSQWLALEPICGPYWDDKAERLVHRRGVPFDYYNNHIYPALQIWAYYNDTYYLNPKDGSGNAPASWLKNTLVK